MSISLSTKNSSLRFPLNVSDFCVVWADCVGWISINHFCKKWAVIFAIMQIWLLFSKYTILDNHSFICSFKVDFLHFVEAYIDF